MKDKGLLIAFEGIDGSGKTTQVEILKNWLRDIRIGVNVNVFKEPTNSEYGQEIKRLSREGRGDSREELGLFLEDRRWNVENNILPALSKKEIVIMDRYYYSNAAYQAIHGNDTASEILWRNENQFPKPDITFLLDIAPIIGVTRIQNIRKEKLNAFEDIQDLQKIRQEFLKIAARDSHIQIIDSSDSIENIAMHIHNIILPFVKEY
jgi:dTMP kinase